MPAERTKKIALWMVLAGFVTFDFAFVIAFSSGPRYPNWFKVAVAVVCWLGIFTFAAGIILFVIATLLSRR